MWYTFPPPNIHAYEFNNEMASKLDKVDIKMTATKSNKNTYDHHLIDLFEIGREKSSIDANGNIIVESMDERVLNNSFK